MTKIRKAKQDAADVREVRGVLVAWQEEVGYRLVQRGEHFMELWCKDRLVKVYKKTAQVETVRSECKEDYIAMIDGAGEWLSLKEIVGGVRGELLPLDDDKG